MTTIGILGAGAAGISMAQALAYAGHTVHIWDADAAVLADINKYHEHRRNFPGVPLHKNIIGKTKPEEVLHDITFIAVPVNAQTELAAEFLADMPKNVLLVHVAAGVRGADGALMTRIWEEVSGDVGLRQVVIAGPNFALEVLQQKFTSVVVAGLPQNAETVANLFEQCSFLRPYVSTDMIGVQIGAAVRHVMAIAAGIADGMGQGMNAQAAIMCRGLAEMARLSKAMGGNVETLMGLAGLGEMIIHAPSKFSRNYRFGVALGQGKTVAEAEADVGVVEGIPTAKMMAYLAAANGLDLAIVSAIDGILNEDVTPDRAFDYLKQRPIMAEFDS